MEFYTYIFWSQDAGKFYVGSSSNLIKRIQDHRAGLSKWTSRCSDWIMVYSISFESRKESLMLDTKIKKRGFSRWLVEYGLTHFRAVVFR